MRHVLPLALSANTITVMWLAGNRHVLAWWLAVAGQLGWFTFIFVREEWGLLPMAVALSIVYTRNLIRWLREGDHVRSRLRGADARRVPTGVPEEDPGRGT